MKSMKKKILSVREIFMDILDLLVLDKLTSIEIMKLIGREMESDTDTAEWRGGMHRREYQRAGRGIQCN